MKLKTTIITIVALVIFIVIAKLSYKNQETNTSAKEIETTMQPPIPQTLTFANEEVPLQNYDTRERLDRELIINTFWHSSTLQILKRSNRYLPQIEKILKKEGVPDDLKYIAIAESGLKNVVSPSGATGFWQFLEGAAKDYKLEISNEIDERYNIEKSTIAACNYLKWLHKKLGSWSLAVAAYNFGKTNIVKQIKRQKCNNYFDLLLPEETQRYIFRILAFKLILNNPEQYGFILHHSDLYPQIETREIKISDKIENFAQFAKDHNITYQTLKMFNPWLRQNYLKNIKHKTYIIKLPTKHFRYKYNHLTF